MSSQVKSAIETAGLPTDNLLITRTSLPEPVHQRHRRTLHTWRKPGRRRHAGNSRPGATISG